MNDVNPEANLIQGVPFNPLKSNILGSRPRLGVQLDHLLNGGTDAADAATWARHEIHSQELGIGGNLW